MNLSQLIKKMFQLIVTKIIEYVNKELDGQEKKTRVDENITDWISENVAKLGPVQKFIVSQYFIPTVPIITQAVYECLKRKIEGLTDNV